ncbi:hypothetical protein [Nocardia africana]|uniref:FAD-containing monooxygenase EthA n=1 Tax=Nocardia africana TaxID=134964 RepID=A0A378WX52_9NOCA|nr:hypothetical protein [Nocardia africana]MCC3313723.1 hypothetical protein [Nocardia africana]SUA44893.1 FAD-containing monooxygenase EthA [Nocardia africana]
MATIRATDPADLTHRLVCKVLDWMDEHGYAAAEPLPQRDMRAQPLLDLAAGYVQRSIGAFPRQSDRAPWRVHQNYLLDSLTTLRTDLDRTLIGTRPEKACNRADLVEESV